jgi:hypothetical protein
MMSILASAGMLILTILKYFSQKLTYFFFFIRKRYHNTAMSSEKINIYIIFYDFYNEGYCSLLDNKKTHALKQRLCDESQLILSPIIQNKFKQLYITYMSKVESYVVAYTNLGACQLTKTQFQNRADTLYLPFMNQVSLSLH